MRKRWHRRPSDGYTGRLFQEETLGAAPDVTTNGGGSFWAARGYAKRHQPNGWIDGIPATGVPRELYEHVVQALGADDVQYFTAIGTDLDKRFGIDAWFEWRGAMLPLDATLRPDVKGEPVVGLLISPDDVERLPMFAATVADALRREAGIATAA